MLVMRTRFSFTRVSFEVSSGDECYGCRFFFQRLVSIGVSFRG
jgi:hypothetical protein